MYPAMSDILDKSPFHPFLWLVEATAWERQLNQCPSHPTLVERGLRGRNVGLVRIIRIVQSDSSAVL